MCGHSPAPKEPSIIWLHCEQLILEPQATSGQHVDISGTPRICLPRPSLIHLSCWDTMLAADYFKHSHNEPAGLATFLTQWKTQWDLKFDRRHFLTARTMQAAIFLPIFQPRRLLCAVASASSQLSFCVTFTDGWKTRLDPTWKWSRCCIWTCNRFH